LIIKVRAGSYITNLPTNSISEALIAEPICSVRLIQWEIKQ